MNLRPRLVRSFILELDANRVKLTKKDIKNIVDRLMMFLIILTILE